MGAFSYSRRTSASFPSLTAGMVTLPEVSVRTVMTRGEGYQEMLNVVSLVDFIRSLRNRGKE